MKPHFPPFSSPSIPCQIQFGNIICVFLFYFPRHQISRSFRPWSNTHSFSVSPLSWRTILSDVKKVACLGQVLCIQLLHLGLGLPRHIFLVWNVHIFRQVKWKECEIRKGGPSSCSLFSVVFKYLGHAFRDENNTVTFCIVRALTFNADTKNSSNPSSKVDKLQVSYIFYISIFSRSAFMESSKHILNSLLSVKRR